MSTVAAAPLFLLLALLMVACAHSEAAPEDDAAAGYIAMVDARPESERPPRWDETRALMMRRAPAPGEMAPDFELARSGGGGSLRLSSLRGDRPVVLIFASYT